MEQGSRVSVTYNLTLLYFIMCYRRALIHRNEDHRHHSGPGLCYHMAWKYFALLEHEEQNCIPSAFICQFSSKAKFLCGDPKTDFSLISGGSLGLDELPI